MIKNENESKENIKKILGQKRERTKNSFNKKILNSEEKSEEKIINKASKKIYFRKSKNEIRKKYKILIENYYFDKYGLSEIQVNCIFCNLKGFYSNELLFFKNEKYLFYYLKYIFHINKNKLFNNKIFLNNYNDIKKIKKKNFIFQIKFFLPKTICKSCFLKIIKSQNIIQNLIQIFHNSEQISFIKNDNSFEYGKISLKDNNSENKKKYNFETSNFLNGINNIKIKKDIFNFNNFGSKKEIELNDEGYINDNNNKSGDESKYKNLILKNNETKNIEFNNFEEESNMNLNKNINTNIYNNNFNINVNKSFLRDSHSNINNMTNCNYENNLNKNINNNSYNNYNNFNKYNIIINDIYYKNNITINSINSNINEKNNKFDYDFIVKSINNKDNNQKNNIKLKNNKFLIIDNPQNNCNKNFGENSHVSYDRKSFIGNNKIDNNYKPINNQNNNSINQLKFENNINVNELKKEDNINELNKNEARQLFSDHFPEFIICLNELKVKIVDIIKLFKQLKLQYNFIINYYPNLFDIIASHKKSFFLLQYIAESEIANSISLFHHYIFQRINIISEILNYFEKQKDLSFEQINEIKNLKIYIKYLFIQANENNNAFIDTMSKFINVLKSFIILLEQNKNI